MESHQQSEYGTNLMCHGLPHLETFTWQNLTPTERVTRSGRPGGGGSPHPSCKRNQIETRDYMDKRGGLPHLPGVPLLHYGKGLFTVGDIETLSLNAATSGNKITQTPLFPLCSKLWCLSFSNWYLESGTTLHRGGGGGKDLYSLFWVGKTLERF